MGANALSCFVQGFCACSVVAVAKCTNSVCVPDILSVREPCGYLVVLTGCAARDIARRPTARQSLFFFLALQLLLAVELRSAFHHGSFAALLQFTTLCFLRLADFRR